MTRQIRTGQEANAQHYSDVTNVYTRELLGAGLHVNTRSGARRHFDGIPNVTLWLVGTTAWSRVMDLAYGYFDARIPGTHRIVIRHRKGSSEVRDGVVLMPFDTAVALLKAWQDRWQAPDV